MKTLLTQIPSVDKISRLASIQKIIRHSPRRLVIVEIRSFLDELRQEISHGIRKDWDLSMESVEKNLILRLNRTLENSLRRGVNGVGIILHTNMGRAPFAHEAQQALVECCANYSTLEVDLNTGKRGHRDKHIEALLCEITGAEAATVVNNNAAATMLVLNEIACGKEVIVSRGELVEIGGSFRIPDVMEQSGATLREVGTTNRTHLKDYLNNIDEELTGALMHVHKSNYYISGFTKEVPLKEIAQAAHDHGLPFYDDLGSGALINLEQYGLSHEPTVQDSLKAGADVVSFSGDKLLGGPQAGIIVGKKEIIDSIRKNQLMRVLRCDKMRYAVLESTLKMFFDEEKLLTYHPVMKMLTEDPEEVRKRASVLRRRLKSAQKEKVVIRLLEDESQVGSGSLSWETIPTWCVAVTSPELSANELGEKLRQASTPVLTRVKSDAVLIDMRTVLHEEVGTVLKAFEHAFGGSSE